MSDENKINRRTALKVIAVGVGTASALPILENNVLSQQKHPGMEMGQGADAAVEAPETPRFFNPQEMATIAIISDLIIPSDEHSPGAKATGIAGFIDLMVSESSNEIRALWRNGLAAIERMSQQEFSTPFISAGTGQQISLLKAISKNERKPKTIEERFFIAIKGLTVDGYYTSELGIHQELQYKGNAYLKEFAGCTHPEHMS